MRGRDKTGGGRRERGKSPGAKKRLGNVMKGVFSNHVQQDFDTFAMSEAAEGLADMRIAQSHRNSVGPADYGIDESSASGGRGGDDGSISRRSRSDDGSVGSSSFSRGAAPPMSPMVSDSSSMASRGSSKSSKKKRSSGRSSAPSLPPMHETGGRRRPVPNHLQQNGYPQPPIETPPSYSRFDPAQEQMLVSPMGTGSPGGSVRSLTSAQSAASSRAEGVVHMWLKAALPELARENLRAYSDQLIADGFDSVELLEKDLAEEDLEFMKKAHRRALIRHYGLTG